MNSRVLLSGVFSVLCLVALWNVFAQRRELVSLRADQQRLLAQTAPPDSPAAAAPADSPAQAQTTPPGASPVSLDLIRLRAEVTRLTERQRELSGVRGENDRLHAQVAARATNAPAAGGLPPGYILRSKAQFVGFNTPEDAIQSFLWAVQNRDLPNFLQAMTPETARGMRAQMQRDGVSTEQFFEHVGQLPGMRIVDRQPQPDGSVLLKVEFVPGVPQLESISARLLDGQWKLELH